MSDNNPHSAALTTKQAMDLAIQHHQAGRLREAEQLYRQILARQPKHIHAMHYLGVIAYQTQRHDMAIDLIRQALAMMPNYAEAHCNLGNVLKDKGRLDEAIAAVRRAIALKPDYADAHISLGNALRAGRQFDEAIAAYRQAITLKPSYAEAHYNLGNALQDKGQFDQAIAAVRQAIALKPNLAEAHHNLALMLLRQGDFQRGWQEYQWRWEWKNFPSPKRNFSQPQWDGSPLEGRTILLYTEQGFGDAIQFIRYLPLVVQRGGKVIVECQTELQRLLRTMHERYEIVAHGEPLPTFDLHSPLLSLPLVFRTTLENIPNIVPYLHADAQDAQRWQERLENHLPKVKVGLVWGGRPTHKNDHNRSIKLSNLAPLGQMPGVRFFSLQKGAAAAEAKIPPAGMELVNWTAELKDFADTAALIANLDLVITVDTAVAHLAGAMGKPVWTLLPFNSDWRWLLERQDSPWYPTMRLFRQEMHGDWQMPIQKLTEELSRLSTAK
jgi:Flp pilus assembly protein TadD